MQTRHHVRVQEPFVRLPIRNDAGEVLMIDLWREDRLDPDPDGDLVYLVLDLSAEERLAMVGGERRYEPTGSVVLDLQAIDRTTGEGLALPHQRIVSPSIPTKPEAVVEMGVIVAYEFSTRPLVGLTHLPVSPRRGTVLPDARD
jgi:hypothetical protein